MGYRYLPSSMGTRVEHQRLHLEDGVCGYKVRGGWHKELTSPQKPAGKLFPSTYNSSPLGNTCEALS